MSRYLAYKTAMMPRDTNAHGTIFGGVLLSQIDLAGSAGAQHAIRSNGWKVQPMVTVAMDKIEFHEPVFVGDLVSYWTEVVRIGQTSITIAVTVETEREGADVVLTRAQATYVAIDLAQGHRRKSPIRGA